MRAAIFALALLSPFGPAACTGSAATLALRPDFVVTTSLGTASVSIRQPPPGMTDAEFVRVVKNGMQAAMPGAVMAETTTAPFPEHRIVWHASPDATRGASRLVVNVFDGRSPLAVEQTVAADDESAGSIASSVRSLTLRLAAAYARIGSSTPAAA